MTQITQPRGKFVEKIIRDANGRLVRASFCVYENGGHIKARLLSVVYLEESISKAGVQLLDLWTPGVGKYSNIFLSQKIVSPFFDSNLLYSSGSKPRAPTF